MNTPAHPMQPVVRDSRGVVRFKANPIVEYLLDWCAVKNGHGPTQRALPHIDPNSPAPDLNTIARMADVMGWTPEDREQLAQLSGYSIKGYGELPYVRDESYERACELVEEAL